MTRGEGLQFQFTPEIYPYLCWSILRQAGLSPEEWEEL